MDKSPAISLISLQSVDGRLVSNERIFDKFDREFLQKNSKELPWFLCSGRLQNEFYELHKEDIHTEEKIPVNYVVLDNYQLAPKTLIWLTNRYQHVYIITYVTDNIGYKFKNVEVISYDGQELSSALNKLYLLGCRKLIVYCDGLVNDYLFNHNLIDIVDVYILPRLSGVSNKVGIVDSLNTKIKLKLLRSKISKEESVHLVYKVLYDK